MDFFSAPFIPGVPFIGGDPGRTVYLGGGTPEAKIAYFGPFGPISPKTTTTRFQGINRAASPTLGRRGRGEGIFVIPTHTHSMGIGAVGLSPPAKT